MGRLRFVDMQQEVYRLRKEHEEVVRTAAKCQEELKEASKMVKSREGSILDVEKDREYARAERDKAWAKLEKA